jgi:Skp family chaperone for outer membrane proteins
LAPLLTLDQDRFFLESDFGRAAVERERAETAALEQENKRIEAELVAEEQALTDQRNSLSAEEFAARAAAFDEKVERIRTEQDSKANLLVEKRDAERKEFLQLAGPILGELLGERQATAILDKGLVIVALSAIDITDEAITKLNAALVAPPAEP